jgi:hypothetical protein
MAGARRSLAAILVATAVVAGAGPRAAGADPELVTVASRVLGLRDDHPTGGAPGKRKFSWAVRSGLDDPGHRVAAPAPGSAGDPTPAGATGGGAELVVYNAAGSGESFTVTLPAARWRLEGNPSNGPRYLYRGDAAAEPVWKVWLKGTKLTVRGGKQHWGYTLDEPSQGRIAIRMSLGTGVTYCADVPPASVASDRPGRFLGQPRAPHPLTCPPVP